HALFRRDYQRKQGSIPASRQSMLREQAPNVLRYLSLDVNGIPHRGVPHSLLWQYDSTQWLIAGKDLCVDPHVAVGEFVAMSQQLDAPMLIDVPLAWLLRHLSQAY